jgi:hypothetical protein
MIRVAASGGVMTRAAPDDDVAGPDGAGRRPACCDDPGHAPPWEMVGHGRYMPRRIRGSLRGRELG